VNVYALILKVLVKKHFIKSYKASVTLSNACYPTRENKNEYRIN